MQIFFETVFTRVLQTARHFFSNYTVDVTGNWTIDTPCPVSNDADFIWNIESLQYVSQIEEGLWAVNKFVAVTAMENGPQ